MQGDWTAHLKAAAGESNTVGCILAESRLFSKPITPTGVQQLARHRWVRLRILLLESVRDLQLSPMSHPRATV